MTQRFIVWSVLLVGLLLTLPSAVFAVSARQGTFDAIQPDGSVVQLRIAGDEWYHYYKSHDNYAVTKDVDGWWVYADLDLSGRYTATPYRVDRRDAGADAFLNSVGKRLLESATYRNATRNEVFKERMPGVLKSAAEIARAKQLTTMSVPVLLIQFNDHLATESVDSFDDMMNQTDYQGVGSFKDYFDEVSYGDLTVNATIFSVSSSVWFTSSQPKYNYRVGDGDHDQAKRALRLAREAVDEAELVGIDWSNFDNDGDGKLDILMVVHEGMGAECGDTSLIWSHHWYLSADNRDTTYDGVHINRYTIQPELSCGGEHIEIGVFCHEFGHALGLPDLYDIDGGSEGIGNWGLMGGGGWGGDGNSPERPSHMCAWSKIRKGWISPYLVDTTGRYTIPDVERYNTDNVFKLWTNGTVGPQYFLVENRQRIGFDANLPTGGLAIWHIDGNQWSDKNTDEDHKLVDLEEADGDKDLDHENNRGDDGDLFPGNSNNQRFADDSDPNSNDYSNAVSRVAVENFSVTGSRMYADFTVNDGDTANLLIRDCLSDVGDEPDGPCENNYFKSPDIWIDNNDDGVIDDPVEDEINHLYIRAWNIGEETPDATVRCWYVNNTVGLVFPDDDAIRIEDAITGDTVIEIGAMGHLEPSSGGQGYRTYFNWNIPSPPQDSGHWCIGCILQDHMDEQTDSSPLADNNLALINYWALSQKSGTTPAKSSIEDGDLTVFEINVAAKNQSLWGTDFYILAETSDPSWQVYPDSVPLFSMMWWEELDFQFTVTNNDGSHLDSTTASFRLHFYDGWTDTIVGGVDRHLVIDDWPPSPVTGFEVESYVLQGDDYPDPCPTHEITWFAPSTDVLGYDERVNYYNIHASTDSASLEDPSYTDLVAKTGLDADRLKDGYQYYYYASGYEVYYFTVVPVDLAGNEGEPSEVTAVPVRGGACCFTAGYCDFISEGECVGTGGEYQGDRVSCDLAGCPGPCCGRYTLDGVTGNVNCSPDGKRTLSDITQLIDHVYISKNPMCCHAAGNTNGSSDCKATLSDITRLIDVCYISKMPAEPCMDECVGEF